MVNTETYTTTKLIEKKQLSMEQLEEIINIIIASNKIKQIILPKGFNPVDRTSIHCIIYGKIGIGKSTILNIICNQLGISPVMSLTKASFLGSIDKQTGILIEPEIWTNRNSILPIDEFDYDHRNPKDKEILKALLVTMENPKYTKKIGYRCNDYSEKDGNLYLKIKNNKIIINTRFSLFMTTMFNPRIMKSQDMKAFCSRCVILPYTPSSKIIFEMIKNKQTYTYKDIKTKDIIKIKIKDVQFILDYVKKYQQEQGLIDGLILRSYGDLIRIFAVIRKHRTDIYDKIITYKKIFTIE